MSKSDKNAFESFKNEDHDNDNNDNNSTIKKKNKKRQRSSSSSSSSSTKKEKPVVVDADIPFSSKNGVRADFFKRPVVQTLPPKPTCDVALVKYNKEDHKEVETCMTHLRKNKVFRIGHDTVNEKTQAIFQDCLATIIQAGKPAKSKKASKPKKAQLKETQKFHKKLSKISKYGEECDEGEAC